jgi:hypothetical protein
MPDDQHDKPLKVLVTADWLQRHVETDPDVDTEAMTPPDALTEAMLSALEAYSDEWRPEIGYNSQLVRDGLIELGHTTWLGRIRVRRTPAGRSILAKGLGK